MIAKYLRGFWNNIKDTYNLIRTHDQRIQEMDLARRSTDENLTQLEAKVATGNRALALGLTNLDLAYIAAMEGDTKTFKRCGESIDRLAQPYLK